MLGNNSMIMAVGYTNLKLHGTMQNHILCPWKQEGKRGHSEVKSYLANKIELHVFQCQSRREVKMNARRSRTRTRRRPGAVRAGGRGRWWKAAAGRVAPETPIQPCAFPAPGCLGGRGGGIRQKIRRDWRGWKWNRRILLLVVGSTLYVEWWAFWARWPVSHFGL